MSTLIDTLAFSKHTGRWVCVLAVLLALGAAARAEAPAFRWAVPPGWRQETIPFPLGFAPELKYRGIEEIRFSPDFFDPGADSYWTYALAWWLEGEPKLDRAALEADLPRYFAGLCKAVGGQKYRFDPARFRAKLEPTAKRKVRGHSAQALQGTVDTYDPFATGKPLTLNLEILTWDCPASGHRVALIAASPKPRSAEVWKALAERQAAFSCHPP